MNINCIYSKSKIILYVTLVFSLASCQGQVKSPKSTVDKFDPYFIHSPDTIAHFAPKCITRNIHQAKDGTIWMATWSGIISYDGKEFVNHTLKEGLIKFHVFSIFEDRSGNLWFGTIRGGLYKYDGKTFQLFTTEDGLADNAIGCMTQDQAGNIWIGTMNGVSKYNGKTFQNFTTEDGLSNNDVNVIVEDNKGQIWFGTRGEGVCYFDGHHFHPFKNKDGLPFNQVRDICIDKKGYFWFGGNDGLWRYDPNINTPSSMPSDETYAGFVHYTEDFIGYIYEDRQGNVWTSSEDKKSKKWKLSRYDIKYLYNEAQAPTVIYNTDGMIFGIMEDVKGHIWMGTGYGAVRYNGTGSKVLFDEFTE